MMRALVVEEFGPFEGHAIREMPDPAPGPGEVAIAVRAMGLNFPDVLMVEGKYRVSTRKAGGQAGMLEVVDFLVAKERQARQQAQ